MKCYSANAIRNIAVLGHSGCGKTSILETALNVAGVTTRIGRIEDGNTVSDYDAEEIKRKVSISTSLIPVEWLDNKINFMDTPGYFDFVGEVKQALSVADIALIVVSAKSGVEVGTEKAWEYATEANIPKAVFVNAMDDENADFDKVVEGLKDKLGKSIAPLQVPFKENGKFVGYVDAVKKEGKKFTPDGTAPCPVPASIVDDVEMMHAMLAEAVAETDDDLMMKFLEDDTSITPEEIESALKKGIAEGIVTPVFCGSAVQNIGIRVLLNSLVRYIPATADIHPSVKAKDSAGNEIEVKCSDNEPVSAFVFKTIADPYVGRMSIFKVMSGVMKRDSMLYNPKQDTVERVSHLYVMRGKDQVEVQELKAGDIGAISKLSNTATQDTLCTKEKPVYFNEIDFPVSYLQMAVVPKGKGDEDKISQAFSKMLEEDKTIKFEINKETKQSVVFGIGDNQLDILVSKLKTKYKLDVDLTPPVIPYREMIKSKIRQQGKYKKQSGGHGQYGDVHIEFEPSGDATSAYIFEEKVFGGSVPRQYFPAVEKGIQECVKSGPLAAYPVVGIKCTLVDGSYHPVDSSEMAFKMATTVAFKEAFVKAKPTILEPIAKVKVSVPDDYTGDVMGDLNKRRGRILGMDKIGTKQVISAEVPMAEMFKYPTDLRSMTQGRGSFSMEFDRYEETPNEVQQKVIEARKKELELDKEKQ